MGVPKITTFIIAMIWISFIALALSLFITNLNNSYGTQDFSDSDIVLFNQMDNLTTDVNKYQASTDIQENTNLLDVIGGYFSAAYQALRGMASSFGIFLVIVNEGFNIIGLGAIGSGLKTAILLSVIVLLFIGVIVAAIVKKDI